MKVNIINSHSKRALDLSGGSLTNGNTVLQYLYHNDWNQKFILEEVNEFHYIFIDSPNPGHTQRYCLQYSNEKFEISIWEFNGGDNQKWILSEESVNVFRIHPKNIPSHCIDLSSKNILTNGAIVLAINNSTPQQLWDIHNAPDYQFPFLSEKELEGCTLKFEELETRLLSVMDEFGFCIVDDVLSSEDIHHAECMLGDDLKEICDFDKSLTSEKEELRNLGERIHSATSHDVPSLWPGWAFPSYANAVPQGRFSWFLRMHPRVTRTYQILYQMEQNELVVGLDGIFFSPTQAIPKPRTHFWGHSDFNSRVTFSHDWLVYQGFVAIWPSVGLEHSATVVWPQSHKEIYQTLIDGCGESALGLGHYVTLSHMTTQSPQVGAEMVYRYVREGRRVPLKPGAMLLMDSKCIHQGWREGSRLVMPVCWEPTSRRPPDARTTKLCLAARGMASTHWASLGIPHPHSPRSHSPSPAQFMNDNRGQAWYLPVKAALLPFPLQEGASLLEADRAVYAVDSGVEGAVERLEALIKPEILDVL